MKEPGVRPRLQRPSRRHRRPDPSRPPRSPRSCRHRPFAPMAQAVRDQLDHLDVDQPDHLVADAGHWHPYIFDIGFDARGARASGAEQDTTKIVARGLSPPVPPLPSAWSASPPPRPRGHLQDPGDHGPAGLRPDQGCTRITRFRRRAIEAVISEWTLIVMIHNLLNMRRVQRHWPEPNLAPAYPQYIHSSPTTAQLPAPTTPPHRLPRPRLPNTHGKPQQAQ